MKIFCFYSNISSRFSQVFVSLGDVTVDEEYFDVIKVNRPYSLDVGTFIDMIEFIFKSSAILISIKQVFFKVFVRVFTENDCCH